MPPSSAYSPAPHSLHSRLLLGSNCRTFFTKEVEHVHDVASRLEFCNGSIPQGHFLHSVHAKSDAYVSFWQIGHFVVRRDFALAVPGPQGVHAVAFVKLENVPGKQSVQEYGVELVFEYVPAGHSVQFEAPMGENEPGGHAAQDDAFAVDEKSPAGHMEHAAAPGPL